MSRLHTIVAYRHTPLIHDAVTVVNPSCRGDYVACAPTRPVAIGGYAGLTPGSSSSLKRKYGVLSDPSSASIQPNTVVSSTNVPQARISSMSTQSFGRSKIALH